LCDGGVQTTILFIPSGSADGKKKNGNALSGEQATMWVAGTVGKR